jgi:CHAT domain-containing protein
MNLPSRCVCRSGLLPSALFVIACIASSVRSTMPAAAQQSASAAPATPRASQFSPEAAQQLGVERERLSEECERFESEGKYAEALAAMERMLAIERRWLPEDHRDVYTSLEAVVELNEVLENWAAVDALRRQDIARAETLFGSASWQAVEAREGLEHTRLVRSWTADDRARWREARREMAEAALLAKSSEAAAEAVAQAQRAAAVFKELYGETSLWYVKGLQMLALAMERSTNYAAAAEVCRQAVEITQAALGAEHARVSDRLLDLGWVVEQRGDYSTALTHYRRSLAIRERVYGAEHEQTFLLISNIGTVLGQLGDFGGSRAAYEKALALNLRTYGEIYPDTALAANNLGVLFRSMGDYEQALQCSERALAIHKAWYGLEHYATAESLNNLGQLYAALGDLKRGREYLEQALAVRRKVRGNDHPVTARTLNDLGSLLGQLGDPGAARAHFEEALAITRRALGPEHPDLSAPLHNLAGVAGELADFDAALAYLQESLAIKIKAVGSDHPELAVTLDGMAGVSMERGDFEAARGYLDRALSLLIKAYGENHPEVVELYGSLAGLLQEQGDFASALSFYEKAYEISRSLLGDEHPTTAGALRGMSYIHFLLGDNDAAMAYQERALAIDREVYGDDHPTVAADLTGLDHILSEQGRWEEARPYSERIYAIYKKTYGEDHPATTKALHGLAILYSQLGDADAAYRTFLESLAATRRLYGDQDPRTASAFANLALHLREQGDYKKARSYLEYALAVYRDFYGDEHRTTALTLKRLGTQLEWMGEPERGEEMLREAVEIGNAMIENAAIARDEQGQLLMARSLRDYLDYYLSCLVRRNGAEAAYRAVLAWKGAAMVRQRALRQALEDEGLRSRFEELQAIVREWSTLARTPGDDLEIWKAKVAELEAKKRNLAAQLAQRSAEFRAVAAPTRLEDLTAAIPADGALVDYLEFRYLELSKDTPGLLLYRTSYLAFVVRPGRGVQMFDLGESESIAEAIDAWRLSFGMSQSAEQAGAALRARLWAPLAAAIGDAKLILVSPDGALGKLPFAALPGSQPGTYLIDDVAVVMIPVPQLLPAMVSQTEAADPPRELLVVGGVNYNSRGAEQPAATPSPVLRPWQKRQIELAMRSIASGGRWQFLPGTDSEVGYISQFYFDATQLARDSDLVVSLRGSAATEEAFRQWAPQSAILHIATHGFFAGEDKESALARSAADGGAAEDDVLDNAEETTIAGYSPGLLSGLVLAGANDPPQLPADSAELAAIPDDGYLTADEIAMLRLVGTQLVILSACDSGLGETAGGEGMLGIQRAFQVAGARTTISSLWKVSDEATRRIMEEFYRNYVGPKGMTPAEALRAAQLWALNNPDLVPRGADAPADEQGVTRLPPQFWAAFTLSGDWR